jgi:hypothetical protein
MSVTTPKFLPMSRLSLSVMSNLWAARGTSSKAGTCEQVTLELGTQARAVDEADASRGDRVYD